MASNARGLLARTPMWLPTVLAAVVFLGAPPIALLIVMWGGATGFPVKSFLSAAVVLSFLLAMSTVLVDRARRRSREADADLPHAP